MDLRYLRSFLLLSEHLNFGRAANAANLSQPALSLQIKNLEQELGVSLFDRNRRATALTQSGQIFVEQAREILRLADKSLETLRKAQKGEVGSLQVGFISTAAALLIPPLVVQFRRKYPGVVLNLRNILTSDQITQLVDRRLDIGLLRLPIAAPPEIRLTKIHSEPFVLLLPKAHPLARSRTFNLKDLKNADFVMYTRKMAPGFHDRILTELHSRGVTPHIVQEAGEMFTLLSLVAAEMGVAIAPKSILLHSSSQVIAKPLPPDFLNSELALAVNTGNMTSAIQLFCALAATLFPTLN
jgi:DNA-binding transcriptional LysR family regulator